MGTIIRLFKAEMAKTWRTKFPYLGLFFSAITPLVAYQSVNQLGAPGEVTRGVYLITSINILTTVIIPIFATIFAAMLIASDTSRGTLRSILPHPITRTHFLNAKLLTGLFYLFLLFAVNLAIALPLSHNYPGIPVNDDMGLTPDDAAQNLIFLIGLVFTIIPQIATVCFGFFISVFSKTVATSIGVAVGIILSLMPLQILIRIDNFTLGDWLFSNYYDTSMKIVENKIMGMYDEWDQSSIYWLLGTSLVSIFVFLGASYRTFLIRDLNS